MKARYQVIVGNIGTVYSGGDEHAAQMHYSEYVNQSAGNYGRASGEPVTLMENGEPVHEYCGDVREIEPLS